MKLNQILLATKVLDSGLLQAKDQTTLVEKGIVLAGDIIPLPGAKAAATIITTGVKFVRERKEQQSIEIKASIASTIGQMEELVERCSRKLTLIYQEQILSLQREGVRLLSESGVRRITEGLTEILQESDALSVTKRMIRRVCFPPTALNSESSLQKLNLKQRHTTYKITSKRLSTKYGSNVIWTDDSAFCKPGIKTKDNEFYSGADTRPEKYGYRLGTKEEALFLHLVQTPKRIVFTLSNSNQTISFPNSCSSLFPPHPLQVLVARQLQTDRYLSPCPSQIGHLF